MSNSIRVCLVGAGRAGKVHANSLVNHVCIQTDTPPEVGGEDGRWAVAGALAGTLSFFEERPVYLSQVLDGVAGSK